MAFDKTYYYREKYKEDSEFRERMKQYVKSYQKTKKGRKTTKRANKRWRKRNGDHIKLYSRKRRQKAIEEGICTRCFKRQAEQFRKSCVECSEKRRAYQNEYQINKKN